MHICNCYHNRIDIYKWDPQFKVSSFCLVMIIGHTGVILDLEFCKTWTLGICPFYWGLEPQLFGQKRRWPKSIIFLDIKLKECYLLITLEGNTFGPSALVSVTKHHMQKLFLFYFYHSNINWCALQLYCWKSLQCCIFVFSFASCKESAKTKHPQLHYESKLYMLLQGGSKFLLPILSVSVLHVNTYLKIWWTEVDIFKCLFILYSRYTSSQVVWSWRGVQCNGNWPSWTKSRRLVQLL